MKVSDETAYQFLTGGNCECTIKDTIRNINFTYHIVQAKKSKNTFWVKVLYAPNQYTFAGTIRIMPTGFSYRQGDKGKFGFDAPSIQLLLRTMSRARRGNTGAILILHLGTCGRCKRPLTDPESIRTGLGPICRNKA